MLDRDVTIVVDPGGARATVVGEIDASNAEDVSLALLSAARKVRSPLKVDLAGVTFMDSTGLRALNDAAQALASSGSGLLLCNVPRQIRRLMTLTGTQKVSQ